MQSERKRKQPLYLNKNAHFTYWVQFLSGLWLRETIKTYAIDSVVPLGFLLIFLFTYLAMSGLSGGMWNLLVVAWGIFNCIVWTLGCAVWDPLPWPGIEPRFPKSALGVQSLNHWTTREVPYSLLLFDALTSKSPGKPYLWS